jgi:hypothetical protein
VAGSVTPLGLKPPQRHGAALSILGVPSKVVLARISQDAESQLGGRCVSAPARGLASEEREGPESPAGDSEARARFGGGGWRLQNHNTILGFKEHKKETKTAFPCGFETRRASKSRRALMLLSLDSE